MITKTRLPFHQKLRELGRFKQAIQIVPSLSTHMKMQQERAHELISDGPQGPLDAASGDLTYHGGPTIGGSAKLFNIYLGDDTFDTADFDAFTKAIIENGYYLSPDGKDGANGKFLGSVKVPWPFPSMVVDDSAIEAWVDANVGSTLIPAEDGSTMYSLIMPASSTVTMQGQASCSAFCGYHSMTSRGNYYQVIDDTSCAGCNSGNPNDGRMMVQAHEYAEWRSDPQGNAWYNSTSGMENADECAWQRIPWGPAGKNWVVQPFWVNGHNCYTGPYVDGGPPPPPPPPPVPHTASMKVTMQPSNAVVGMPAAPFSVSLLLADGTVNTADNSTQVTAQLANFTIPAPQKVTAVNGVCSFHGDTFQNAHQGANALHYVFTAAGLFTVLSATFEVAPSTPPPPPPPGPATKTHQLDVYSDGTVKLI